MISTTFVPTTLPAVADCADNITAEVESGQTTVTVSLPGPQGDVTNASLPVGEYECSYQLQDGTICQFTVAVTSSKCLPALPSFDFVLIILTTSIFIFRFNQFDAL